jgi:anhydro-N-acetylmuramic acid kinase
MPNKNSNKRTYAIIGVMSGTSLDGLDLCFAKFSKENSQWKFDILKSETIKYSDNFTKELSKATTYNGELLTSLNIRLGKYFGEKTKEFITTNQLTVDYIASHGHTIFHQPENNFTLQIGSGQEIANITSTPVIYDFRTKDVSLGGQGAPLVPIGDQKLFPKYDACINLGGIANISFQNKQNQRVAFDICSFNMGLNHLANKKGLNYDDQGRLAKKGNLIPELLSALNELEFYKLPYPKSLGIEWFNHNILPLIETVTNSIEDILNTLSNHISEQISIILNDIIGQNILITGGGAYNTYIIDLIKSKTDKNIQLPSNQIIDFKEALVFAFLGVLNIENEVNVLKSVTGASSDSVSGIIAHP